jgi:hypothetical protein
MGPDYEEGLDPTELDYDAVEGVDGPLPPAEEWDHHLPEDMPAEAPPEEESGEGDVFFYESDPVFVALRQAAIGWCNIYAAILPPDVRPRGLRILFHIGRSLANLAYSIDDGMYEQPAASIAFAKRSLGQLNAAIGMLNELIDDKPRLRKLLETIRSHLIRSSESLVDHLHRCRSGAGGSPSSAA